MSGKQDLINDEGLLILKFREFEDKVIKDLESKENVDKELIKLIEKSFLLYKRYFIWINHIYLLKNFFFVIYIIIRITFIFFIFFSFIFKLYRIFTYNMDILH